MAHAREVQKERKDAEVSDLGAAMRSCGVRGVRRGNWVKLAWKMVMICGMALDVAGARAAKDASCAKVERSWSSSGVSEAGWKKLTWVTSGMTLCKRFEKATCCARAQTDKLFMLWRAVRLNAENVECAEMFETALCMECDPMVGTGRVKQMCRKTCEMWFDACKDEFFEAKQVSAGGALAPCGPNSVICSPLREFVASGMDLCTSFGFNIGEEMCYSGVADPKLRAEVEAKPAPPRREPPPPVSAYQTLLEEFMNPLYLLPLLGFLPLLCALYCLNSNSDQFPERGYQLGGERETSRLLDEKED